MLSVGRTYEQQSAHDSLVRMMAAYFSTLGYSALRADLNGYPRPTKIWWTGRESEAHIPDLTCFKNDPQQTPIILEAETCESVGLEHTRQQWLLFSAHARAIKGEFHVVVPRICYRGTQPVTGQALVEEYGRAWGLTFGGIWWQSG